MAGYALVRHTTIALVDGCNRFDVHTLIRFAQEKRRSPDELLRRIFVSRGFTCYQMEAAVTRKLPEFFRRHRSHTGIILGLLDTMYDEQAPLREVQKILVRMREAFHEMKTQGASILVACQDVKVLPLERNALLGKLKSGMDGIFHARLDNTNTFQLYTEQHTMS